jgi:hypothetical protein
MTKLETDYSTINMEELEKLPKYNTQSNRHISKSMGSCCAHDAPGFPTYFIQHIYNGSGNDPRTGPTEVILGHVTRTNTNESWDEEQKKHKELMMKLWNKLPLDHERTKAWILSTYIHFNNCYYDENNEIIIYPVPSYKLQEFRNDKRFNDEWRETEKKRIELENNYILNKTKKIATPENHMAVRTIQKFYPEYKPNIELINNPPRRTTGNWWEIMERRPSPKECPGEPRWGGRHEHPINRDWCQKCGWHKEEKEEMK